MKTLKDEWEDRKKLIEVQLKSLEEDQKSAMLDFAENEFYCGAAAAVIVYSEEVVENNEIGPAQALPYFVEATRSMRNEIQEVQKRINGDGGRKS